MYTVMCRKLYLSSKLEEGDARIDVQECMENMKEDWKEDTVRKVREVWDERQQGRKPPEEPAQVEEYPD